MSGKIGLAVNPMSGRDVRRIAARATNMTHEAKRDIVARVVAGADAMGVTDIYIGEEPFQISSLAVAHMELRARVHAIKHPLNNDASDTERLLEAYLDAGCRTIVSLGGDGTNRAIVRAITRTGLDIDLIPLSTGTNNVFPVLAEPTVAGMVAGLNAIGHLADANLKTRVLKARVKVLHVRLPDGSRDVGLIDAVLLKNDHVGNLLPFRAEKIARLVLSRAEPDAVGMSPIGGFLQVVDERADSGLMVEMGPGRKFTVPLSPGLFSTVEVADHQPLPFDVPVLFRGPGVLALDGDRDHKIAAGETAQVTLRRDGPFGIDLGAAMRWAVAQGMIAAP